MSQNTFVLTDSDVDLVLAGILLEVLSDTCTSVQYRRKFLGREDIPRMGSWGLPRQLRLGRRKRGHTPGERLARSL